MGVKVLEQKESLILKLEKEKRQLEQKLNTSRSNIKLLQKNLNDIKKSPQKDKEDKEHSHVDTSTTTTTTPTTTTIITTTTTTTTHDNKEHSHVANQTTTTTTAHGDKDQSHVSTQTQVSHSQESNFENQTQV